MYIPTNIVHNIYPTHVVYNMTIVLLIHNMYPQHRVLHILWVANMNILWIYNVEKGICVVDHMLWEYFVVNIYLCCRPHDHEYCPQHVPHNME